MFTDHFMLDTLQKNLILYLNHGNQVSHLYDSNLLTWEIHL